MEIGAGDIPREKSLGVEERGNDEDDTENGGKGYPD